MKPNQQQFGIINKKAAEMRFSPSTFTLDQVEETCERVNRTVYSFGEAWLEPFGVDNANTPSYEQLIPRENEEDVLNEEWEWIDTQARRLV